MMHSELYICTMLNIGIIGDISALEKYILQIRKNKNAQIIGKSSVGINRSPENFQFTIPEFNKVELIDRADVLIINNFSLLSFSTLCGIVKKSKHIFATDYPELTVEECRHLVKLTSEAKTIFQLLNPFYNLDAMRWLNENLKYPALLDVSCFKPDAKMDKLLIQLLLMLKGTTKTDAKKTGAVTFKGSSDHSVFHNLNLQFGDASVVNINYGKMDVNNEFILKSYADGQFVLFNFNTKIFTVNNSPINLKPYSSITELELFIDSANGKKHTITLIEDYSTVIEGIQKIEKKMSQFSGQ
ncbi:MAG TPA: hypothetical protein VKA10_04610 [Prolixibacteraceae bacterium]|nr:hypothetical protein [Prolixibacteraceae bacterium]